MYTNVQNKEGVVLNIVSQEYITGIYVILNNNPKMQFVSNLNENELHLKMRKDALKIGSKLLSGSILDYKGKLPINTFEE